MIKSRITAGPDYDPATDEPLHDAKGNLIDQGYLDEADAHLDTAPDIASPVTRGRPSLTGRQATSPQIRVRVTPDLRDKLQAKAEAEHVTISEEVRRILERAV